MENKYYDVKKYKKIANEKGYKLIEGYAHPYAINKKQELINLHTGRLKKKYYDKQKRRYVYGLQKVPYKTQPISVSRLMVQAFGKNPLNLFAVHHINGIQTDDRLSNLVALDTSEHMQAHKLMKTNKKEYKAKMKHCKRANNGNYKKAVYNDDYSQDGNSKDILHLTAEGYRKYKKTGVIPLDSILFERECDDKYITEHQIKMVERKQQS